MENKNFSVKCCLLACNIVVLGLVVSLELLFCKKSVCCFLSRTSYLPTSGFFLRRCRYFEKATSFCREVLMFLPSIWLSLCFSSSMNRSFAPFVPSRTT